MSDVITVIFANDAFYAAFAGRDIAAMNDAWSRSAQVTCIHPGWPPLSGRATVMKSWRSILLSANSPDIVCRNPQAHVHGNIAYVVCFEQIGEAFLIATNIFVREGGGWRLLHHQAGPTPKPELSETSQPEPALQ